MRSLPALQRLPLLERTALPLLLALVCMGCTFTFGKPPPARWAPGQPIASCDRDHELVDVDLVVGSLLTVGGTLAGGLILGTHSDGGALVASLAFGGALWGLIHVVSALKGRADVKACHVYQERAKQKLPWPLPQEVTAPSPQAPSTTSDEAPQRRRMGD